METADVKLDDGTVIAVPMPRVPPKPRIKWSKRRKLARQWLRQFSQSLSADRVDSLALHVGRFHPKSKLGQIASTFVAHNQLPVCEEVVAVYLRERAAEIQRESAAEEELEDAVRRNANLEAEVIEMIDAHLTQGGQGPTWSAIGASFALSRDATAILMKRLKNQGAVTFSKDKGSLRLTGTSATRAQAAYVQP